MMKINTDQTKNVSTDAYILVTLRNGECAVEVNGYTNSLVDIWTLVFQSFIDTSILSREKAVSIYLDLLDEVLV